MPPNLIVDGNNLIGARPDGWWRDRSGATRRLVGELGRWSALTGRELLVVFDGPPPPELAEPPGIEVRFATRPGRDAADDVIAQALAESDSAHRLTVVTSDAGLASRVRASGASVRGSGAFREELDGVRDRPPG